VILQFLIFTECWN